MLGTWPWEKVPGTPAYVMGWLRVAAVLGFLAVGLGAFGAHALRDRLSERMLSVYNTAVLYQLVHSVALLAIALYAKATGASIAWPAWCFSAGILLFSGSLYVMAVTGWTKLGAVTPLGGLALLGGWAALFFAVTQRAA